MIGMFGNIVFEVSGDSILNFEGFTRNTASKYKNHELIGQKPRTEFVAPGLDTVSFTVLLNANHGVKPREEMNRWLEYCRGGDAETLMIGTGALGVDKWVVTSVSQHWDSIYNQGELVAGKVDITLQEYVSNTWTVQGYREDLKKIAAAKAGKSAAARVVNSSDAGYTGKNEDHNDFIRSYPKFNTNERNYTLLSAGGTTAETKGDIIVTDLELFDEWGNGNFSIGDNLNGVQNSITLSKS